jgi:hypothetical protein
MYSYIKVLHTLNIYDLCLSMIPEKAEKIFSNLGLLEVFWAG